MKTNMGSADRSIRILMGIIIGILVMGHMVTGFMATVLVVLSGILIITGFVEYCPLYSIFHINTCTPKKN